MRTFIVMALFVFSVPTLLRAESISLDLFRYMESGQFQKVSKLIEIHLSKKPQIATYFNAHLAFYQQDYAKARKLLKSIKEPKDLGDEFTFFKTLVDETFSRTQGFTELRAQHFTLRFKPGKDLVLALYGKDVLDAAYREIGNDLGVKPKRPMVIEFFPSWKDFIAVSTLTEKEVKTSGTVALCKFNRMMVTTPRALLQGYRWMDTVAHEYVHYLINRATQAQAPVWFHEGLAKYEEVRWRKSTGGEIGHQTKALLKKRLKNKTLIPFEKMHPSIAKLKTAEDAEVAFAEVFYFIRYLIEEKGGWPKMRKVLASIRNGYEAKRAITQVHGMEFKDLYKIWLTWLSKQNLPDDPGAKPRQIVLLDSEVSPQRAERENLKDISDSKAKDLIRIGDLLLERDRTKAALIEYKKADTYLKTPSVYLLNKMSIVALMQGDNTQAEQTLTKAIKIAPTYPASYIRRGHIYLEKKAYLKAENDFLMANRINPFDPGIHRGLKRVYENTNDKMKLKRTETILEILN